MSRKITVIIVEDHNEVLYHIYRAIGAKKIPFSGLKLLHFDSHPDLGIPDLECSLIKQDYQFLQSLSIENWIMPAIYAEHIDHVIWMKPKWSTQISPRKAIKYSIGEEVHTGRLCVNVPESYFVDDGVFGRECHMVKPVNFSLSVCDIHEAHTACKDCSDIVFSLLNKPFIVDIDLDAFSCQDPFKERFSSYQRDLIDQLYGMPTADYKSSYSDEDVARQVSLARREQLKRLGDWIDMIKAGDKLPDCEEASKLMDLCLSVKVVNNPKQLASIVNSKKSASQQTFVVDSAGDLPDSDEEDGDEVNHSGAGAVSNKDKESENEGNEESLDYLHYLWSGMDSKSDSLPHHINNDFLIKSMVGEVESILNRLHNPLLLTISRSSADGYTPPNQVTFIQKEVECMLTRVYGDKILNYELAYLKPQEQRNSSVNGRPSSPPAIQHSTRERKPIKGRRGIV